MDYNCDLSRIVRDSFCYFNFLILKLCGWKVDKVVPDKIDLIGCIALLSYIIISIQVRLEEEYLFKVGKDYMEYKKGW